MKPGPRDDRACATPPGERNTAANLRIGMLYRKLPGGRTAQITAVTGTHAVMYWPDRDTQTLVRADRLSPHHHWMSLTT